MFYNKHLREDWWDRISDFLPTGIQQIPNGICNHSDQSQGMTVNQAFVLETPHSDRHTIYVALSRHKGQVKLYASTSDFRDNASLERSLGRNGDKLSTLDFTDAQRKETVPSQNRQQNVQTLRNEFMCKAQAQAMEQNRNQVHRTDNSQGLEMYITCNYCPSLDILRTYKMIYPLRTPPSFSIIATSLLLNSSSSASVNVRSFGWILMLMAMDFLPS